MKNVFVLLMLAFTLFGAEAPMVFKINTNLSTGTTIELAVSQMNSPTITIDWGDGSVEEFTGTLNERTNTYYFSGSQYQNHTYAEDGEYTVSIYGDITHYGSDWGTSGEKRISITEVVSWGDLPLTHLDNAFASCRSLTSVPATIPSSIISLRGTFSRAETFNGDLSGWDVSNVTNMEKLFYTAKVFNGDLSGWDVSNVVSMRELFSHAEAFNCDISGWNTGSVTNMYGMFMKANAFTADISGWNISNVTNMTMLFDGLETYTCDLSGWDVSGVTNMKGMFSGFHGSVGDISGWDVSNVTDMNAMFSWGSFSPDISNWDVSSVTNMGGMFVRVKNFTFDISNWDVSNVTNMYYMFASVNADIDLSKWQFTSVTNIGGLFNGGMLKGNSYDNLLISLAQQNLQSGLSLQVSYSTYKSPEAAAARQKLIDDFGWTIEDRGEYSEPLVMKLTIKTPDVTSVQLGFSGTVDAVIDWDNGLVERASRAGSKASHYYKDGSTLVKVYGSSDTLGKAHTIDSYRKSITGVMSWGEFEFTSLDHAFEKCINLTELPATLPIAVTELSNTFRDIPNFSVDISSWDFSNITTMEGMFANGSMVTENYDKLLIALAGQTLQSGVTFDAGASIHSRSARAAKQKLINDFGWTIIDGGEYKPEPMVMLCNTNLSTGTTIQIPLSGTVDVTIDWGDGVVEGITTAGFAVHTYETDGEYTVKVYGAATGLGLSAYDNFEYRKSLTDVTTWGEFEVTNLNHAFSYYLNLKTVPTTLPHTVDSLQFTFNMCENFNSDLSQWDVSNVKSMSSLFQGTTNFNSDLSGWNVSNVTQMSMMFYEAENFTSDLSSWNVSKVTNTSYMFAKAGKFTSDLSGWDVSSVTRMDYMFNRAFEFESDLNSWNVSNVTNMNYMFLYTHKFNCDLTNWDVSSVETMQGMFQGTLTFNGDISTWNISKLRSVQSMFQNSKGFDRDISTWDFSSMTNMNLMFTGTSLSKKIYDKLLISLSQQSLQSEIIFDMGASQYSPTAAAARQKIIDDFSWTINDGGQAKEPMVLKFNTNLSTGTTVEIPLSSTVDVVVDWGDGTSESITAEGVYTHTYAADGEYSVTITGSLERFGVAGVGGGENRKSLVAVDSWGELGITSLHSAFMDCDNLTSVPAELPTTVTDLRFTFYKAKSFNGDLSAWDVSRVTHMHSLFRGAESFNGDISGWNVSKVLYMSNMFHMANSFNGDLSRWDVSSVTSMTYMFSNAVAFNSDLSNWNVSKVDNMSYMFKGASLFNQDISSWNVSSVVDMRNMFNEAIAFNQDLGTWDVSTVENMIQIFDGATSFDQNLGDWDISKVSYVTWMFRGMTLSVENYDALLIGWEKLDLVDSRQLEMENMKHSRASLAAKTAMTNPEGDDKWTITDGGMVPNKAPQFTSEPVLTIPEAVEFSFTVVTVDPENDGVAVTSSVLPEWLTFDGTTLVGTPPANNAGDIAITFIATDDFDGVASEQLFTLTITGEDDAPVVKTAIADITVEEDAPDMVVSLAELFTDIDNDDALIVITLTGNSNESLVTAVVDGDLKLSFLANQFGESRIELTGTSNGKAVATSFKVTVTPVDDIEVIAKDSTASATVQGSVITTELIGELNKEDTVITTVVNDTIRDSLFTVTETYTEGALTNSEAVFVSEIVTINEVSSTSETKKYDNSNDITTLVKDSTASTTVKGSVITTELIGELDKEDTVITTTVNDTIRDSLFSVTETYTGDNLTNSLAVFVSETVTINEISSTSVTKEYQVPVALTDNATKIEPVNLSANPVRSEENSVVLYLPSGNGRYDVKIFDAVGNVLLSRSGSLSDREIIWDLTNRAGSKVSSGSYLVMIKVKESDGTVKLQRSLIGVQR